jgi:hypothetical protein
MNCVPADGKVMSENKRLIIFGDQVVHLLLIQDSKEGLTQFGPLAVVIPG